MARKIALFLMILVLALTGCSMQVSKDDGKKADTPKPTADLPKERQVRQIELLVTTADYDPVRYEFGMMIADEWKKLGFDVKVTPMAWNKLSEVGMKDKDFDAFTLAWAGRADRIDPDHFVYATLDSSQQGKGAYNIVGYNNPEYDKIAEEQRRVTDPEKRKELVYKAQEIFMQDLPYAPVVHRNQLMAYNKKDFTNMSYMMGKA